MKKIVVVLFVLCATLGYANDNMLKAVAAPTYTKVVKYHRGIFGYKDVYQTQSGTDPNNVILGCANPGFKDCKYTISAYVTGGLNTEDIDIIQSTVDGLILTNQGVGGNYVYNNDYLVIYSINLATDETIIEILTRAEAAERGITI